MDAARLLVSDTAVEMDDLTDLEKLRAMVLSSHLQNAAKKQTKLADKEDGEIEEGELPAEAALALMEPIPEQRNGTDTFDEPPAPIRRRDDRYDEDLYSARYREEPDDARHRYNTPYSRFQQHSSRYSRSRHDNWSYQDVASYAARSPGDI